MGPAAPPSGASPPGDGRREPNGSRGAGLVDVEAGLGRPGGTLAAPAETSAAPVGSPGSDDEWGGPDAPRAPRDETRGTAGAAPRVAGRLGDGADGGEADVEAARRASAPLDAGEEGSLCRLVEGPDGSVDAVTPVELTCRPSAPLDAQDGSSRGWRAGDSPHSASRGRCARRLVADSDGEAEAIAPVELACRSSVPLDGETEEAAAAAAEARSRRFRLPRPLAFESPVPTPEQAAKHGVVVRVLAAVVGYPLDGSFPLRRWLRSTLGKPWWGSDWAGPPPVLGELTWTLIGSFLSILAIAATDRYTKYSLGFDTLLPSFGASAVLIFAAPSGRFSQPWNLVAGHTIGASIGAAFRRATHHGWMSSPLGMAFSLLIMQIFRAVHPPGGATAILAAHPAGASPWGGFAITCAALIGAGEMLVVAMVVNNVAPQRHYPTYYFPFFRNGGIIRVPWAKGIGGPVTEWEELRKEQKSQLVARARNL